MRIRKGCTALAGYRAVSANTPVRFSSLKHFGNRVLGCCLTKTVGGWSFKIGEVKKKRKETTILLSVEGQNGPKRQREIFEGQLWLPS